MLFKRRQCHWSEGAGRWRATGNGWKLLPEAARPESQSLNRSGMRFVWGSGASVRPMNHAGVANGRTGQGEQLPQMPSLGQKGADCEALAGTQCRNRYQLPQCGLDVPPQRWVAGECSRYRNVPPSARTPKGSQITEAVAPCENGAPLRRRRKGGVLARPASEVRRKPCRLPFKSGALDFPSCGQPRPPSSPQIATLTRLLAPASRPSSSAWKTGTPHSSPRIGGPSVQSAQTPAVVTGSVFHQSRNTQSPFVFAGVLTLSCSRSAHCDCDCDLAA